MITSGLEAERRVSITKVPLAEGGRDVLLYTTVSGAVGALIPFISADDVEFMSTLEMVSWPLIISGFNADIASPAHEIAECVPGRTGPPCVSRILRASEERGGWRSV